ncbi:MAG: M61 family metallopeptidase [Thiotrichales bacterium]|mgnify:FL=1|jgi:predicted metalloprotease with PDZ domain|nr:M61 family metallopeptidase [Thiotrichales bacterium]MBT3752648.1 M61 family metallopeptidase [Thiotrichales bacterium]MBT3837054.1 M61 family metallopeptidase [Thiotrichales bacterium]MBT4152883.1 M61 family metallopeptidase [Thiotrichales bacterium]MBT4261054.1 M61 family metallopeptidase [Thiotrichales bacterium]
MINYTLSIANANAHHFEVELDIKQPDPNGQLLSLPAWIPGSYMVRDFAKNILWIRARSSIANGSADSDEVAIEKIDKQSWRCDPCSGTLSICYAVYAWDLSVRSAHLDQTHAFINGSSLFLSVANREKQKCHLNIISPSDFPEWKVATAMPIDKVNSRGFGNYLCSDYEELIDHPIEIGSFVRGDFSVHGVPHSIILTGRQSADLARITNDLSKICEYHCNFFGDKKPPMQQYIFLTTVVGSGYGGLEHRDSCALICSREDLPLSDRGKIDDGYRKFLGLCSHEYFHLWNIKRIRPTQFYPYRLDAEVYTKQLWAYEGITSYFDDLALLKCGLISRESYLELLSETLTRVERNRGKEIQSVTDSSFDAWTKFYKQDENANNAIVSYYTKGAVIALMVDLWLQQESSGKYSLKNVMKDLWQQHGTTALGTDEKTIEKLCHKVAILASGRDIPFLTAALYSTKQMIVEPLLKKDGVKIEFTTTPFKPSTHKTLNWLGAELNFSSHKSAEVRTVRNDSPIQQAGVSAGDTIIAIDHIQASIKSAKMTLKYKQIGDSITIHLFRRDELMELKVVVAAELNNYIKLTILDNNKKS